MLKVVQGTIAAVKAKQDDTKLPSNTVEGPNIFDDNFDKKKIKEYIEKNLDEDLVSLYVDNIKDCYDYDSTISFLVDRLMDIKSNNYPSENSYKRKDMPQVFKAGTNKKDKKTAYPDKEGSALNKLKDDKFTKKAIQ